MIENRAAKSDTAGKAAEVTCIRLVHSTYRYYSVNEALHKFDILGFKVATCFVVIDFALPILRVI